MDKQKKRRKRDDELEDGVDNEVYVGEWMDERGRTISHPFTSVKPLPARIPNHVLRFPFCAPQPRHTLIAQTVPG